MLSAVRRLFVGMMVLLVASPTWAQLDVDVSWIDTNSPQWVRFDNWVDAAVGGSPGYAFSASDAALAGHVLNDPAACGLAVDLVEDEVAEAEALIALGLRPPIAYDSYLEVGPRVRDLALTLAWCGDGLSALDRQRWLALVEQAVWNVWHHEDAVWGVTPHPWSGWSVEDPGNNYHFSFLLATVYVAAVAEDANLLTFLTDNRFPQLVAYYTNLVGGGSREGTGYGLAHMNLFELLRLWRDLGHGNPALATTHARDSIDYWVHATVPTFEFVAPIGDQSRSSMPELYDYHRRVMLEARNLAVDVVGRGLASWWLNTIPVDEMQSGFNFRHDLLPAGPGGAPPSRRSYHATGVGQFFSRARFAPDALWISIVAGPYDQSHAHQEQGGFTLFRGTWLAVTENVFTHSGIQQGTEVHNVLRFVGPGSATVPQRESVSSFAATDNGIVVSAIADLSPAFASGSDGVVSWTREFTFRPVAGTLGLRDLYQVDPGVEAVWQLNVPVLPTIAGDGSIHAGDLHIVPVLPATPTISIVDWSTVEPGEFLSGWKIELRGGSGEYRVNLIDQVTAAKFVFADGFESGNLAAWSSAQP